MHFIPNNFQDIFVALGKVIFPEGGFVWDGTTTIDFQKKIFSSSLFRTRNGIFVDIEHHTDL
jgi:hypothetical protein